MHGLYSLCECKSATSGHFYLQTCLHYKLSPVNAFIRPGWELWCRRHVFRIHWLACSWNWIGSHWHFSLTRALSVFNALTGQVRMKAIDNNVFPQRAPPSKFGVHQTGNILSLLPCCFHSLQRGTMAEETEGKGETEKCWIMFHLTNKRKKMNSHIINLKYHAKINPCFINSSILKFVVWGHCRSMP